MVKVRRATPDDLLEVFKLGAAMHAEGEFSSYTFNAEKTLNTIAGWDNGGDRALFIADNDGEVIGMMAAVLTDSIFSDDLCAMEHILYVRSDKRGSRAAYLLVKAFVQWAHDSNAKHIRAGVSMGSGGSAHRLYEHFGMKHVGGNFTAHL